MSQFGNRIMKFSAWSVSRDSKMVISSFGSNFPSKFYFRKLKFRWESLGIVFYTVIIRDNNSEKQLQRKTAFIIDDTLLFVAPIKLNEVFHLTDYDLKNRFQASNEKGVLY